MLSFKSIGKSPAFELNDRVVFGVGEEANENNFNSLFRTDVNPLLLSPPELTGGNMTVTSPMTFTPPDPTGGNLMTPLTLSPPEPTDGNWRFDNDVPGRGGRSS